MVKRANYLILRHEGSYRHVREVEKEVEGLGRKGAFLRTDVGQSETDLCFQLDRSTTADFGQAEVLSTDYLLPQKFKPWRDRVWRRLIRAVGFEANGVWNARPEDLSKGNFEAVEENLILRLGALPIDWKYQAFCESCGVIPAPKWLENARLQNCQLCYVEGRKAE